jgi:hypothetical protein
MTMSNKVSIYYFCVFFVLFASCNRKATKAIEKPTDVATVPTNPTPPPTPKTIDDKNVYEVINIRRTPCYGNCPVYEAKLMSNGKVYYNGTRAVDMIGNYEANADAERLKDLWKNIEQVKFFDFANKYPLDEKNQIADLPSCILTINDGKQKKRIEDNYDSPANLQWIEHEIETFFLQTTWTESKN